MEEIYEIKGLIRGTQEGQIKWRKEVCEDPGVKHYVAETNNSPWIFELTLSGLPGPPIFILHKVQYLFGRNQDKDITDISDDGGLLQQLADTIEESLLEGPST